MKIRHGFVSNSSTSSFCIIGVRDSRIIKKLLDTEGIVLERDYKPKIKTVRGCDHEEPKKGKFCSTCGRPAWEEVEVDENQDFAQFDEGIEEGEHIDFYTEGDSIPSYAGIDAEPILASNTIPQAQVFFQRMIKEKFDIGIPLKNIKFHCGICYSE